MIIAEAGNNRKNKVTSVNFTAKDNVTDREITYWIEYLDSSKYDQAVELMAQYNIHSPSIYMAFGEYILKSKLIYHLIFKIIENTIKSI